MPPWLILGLVAGGLALLANSNQPAPQPAIPSDTELQRRAWRFVVAAARVLGVPVPPVYFHHAETNAWSDGDAIWFGRPLLRLLYRTMGGAADAVLLWIACHELAHHVLDHAWLRADCRRSCPIYRDQELQADHLGTQVATLLGVRWPQLLLVQHIFDRLTSCTHPAAHLRMAVVRDAYAVTLAEIGYNA